LLFDQPEAVGGGKGRLLAFKLGGTETLDIEPKIRIQPEPPARSGDEMSVARGSALYNKYCMRCHGINGIGSGVVADLRYMSEGSYQVFDDIVLKGIFSGLGMVSFADELDENDTKDIRHYLTKVANEKWDDDQASDTWIQIRNGFYDMVGKTMSLFF
jgi:quinohemoprotein ethanol dehydrogenase